MIWLVVTAVAMVAATAAWLIWGLGRAVATGAAGEGDLQALRDRLLAQLRELDEARAEGVMDAAIAADEERRLSAELAGVLKQIEQAPAPAAGVAGARRWPAMMVLVVVTLLGAVLYGSVNHELVRGLARQVASGAQTNLPPQVLEMVARLEQRLADNPNDATGWARLGRAYSVMERREDALAAFDRAEKLAPEDREILAEYAWTLFSANPANTEGRVYDLYSRLLRLDPNNPDALWFMGLASHQRGNPRDSLRLWTRLAQVLPKDDPAQAELAKVIERTRAEMNERRI